MTVGCGNTLTHITPHKASGQAPLSPGQAGPSPHKPLIDLMDFARRSHPFSKQTVRPRFVSIETKRQCPPSIRERERKKKREKAAAREGSARLPTLLISPLGLGEGLSMLRKDSSRCKWRLPPPFFQPIPGQPELTPVHIYIFISPVSLRALAPGSRCTTEAHSSCFYLDWSQTSAKWTEPCGFLKDTLPTVLRGRPGQSFVSKHQQNKAFRWGGGCFWVL